MAGSSGGGKVGETEDERILSRIGVERFQEYQKMYPEIENQFFGKIDNLNSDNSYQRGADSASVSATQQFAQASGLASKSMAAGGINPSEGQYKQTIKAGADESGIARAENVNQTQQAIQDSYIGGKKAIVAMGQGQEAEAIQGFGEIASASANKAGQDAISAFQKTNSRNSAIATGAGAIAGGVISRKQTTKPKADASGVNLFDYSSYS